MNTTHYQSGLNKIYIIIDMAVLLMAYALAWVIRIINPWFGVTDQNQQIMKPVYLAVLIVIIPVHLLLYFYFHVYDKKIASSQVFISFSIIKANIICLLSLTFFLYLYGKRQPFYDFSRSMLLLYFILNTILSILSYKLNFSTLYFLYSKECNKTHILLVGYSPVTEDLIDRINSNIAWGYQIHGILDDHRKQGDMYKGISVIGTISDLQEQLKQGSLNEVAITLGIEDYGQMEDIVNLCEKSGVHTKFIPDYKNIIPTIPYIEDFQGMPIIHIRRLPLNNLLNRLVKRFLDILGAVFFLIVLSPLLFFMVLRVKLLFSGTVLVRDVCVGMHSKNFGAYEFRTTGIRRKMKSGYVFKITGLVKIPRLFNVLKGEMSFIGPRVECPAFVEQQKKESSRYMIRYQVRPGITGWAQVKGCSEVLTNKRQLAYDLYYIENWTLIFDGKIILFIILNIFNKLFGNIFAV